MTRDEEIYAEYRKGLEYRQKNQADKFQIPIGTYRTILAKMKVQHMNDTQARRDHDPITQ